MSTKAKVFEEFEAMGRLDALGLTGDVLRDAAFWAYQYHASQVTDNEPLNARGLTMYFKTTRALRDRLAEKGWTKSNPKGQARTVHPDGEIAIVVSGGNENTGMRDFNPATVSTKGKASADAIAAGQVELFDSSVYVLPTTGPEMWYLLVYAAGAELRLELSRPLVVRSGGVVSEWAERILLPAIPFADDAFVGANGAGPGPEPIDVEVRRRVD